jgi:choline kinase
LTRTKFIVNPKFGTTGNAFSLLLAREFYLAEEKRGAPLHPLLILDSDLWLDDSVLQLVVDGSAENKVAFRVDGEHDDEEVRVALRANGTIAAIGKNLHGNPNVGESVGVELFSPVAAKRMFEILEQRVRSGTGRTEFYEATFQQMIEEGIPLHAINIGKRFAMEVDTLEDFELLQRIARE